MGDADAQWVLAHDEWPGVHGDKVASQGVSGFERRCLGLAGGLGVKNGGGGRGEGRRGDKRADWTKTARAIQGPSGDTQKEETAPAMGPGTGREGRAVNVSGGAFLEGRGPSCSSFRSGWAA